MQTSENPILVVDDDSAVRDVLLAILLLEGYSVREAVDGAEALEMIEAEHPSLVVLDMQMPRLDGWGVARELNVKGLHPPILVMTAGVNAERAAREIGAAGYLGKPFELMDVINKVEELRAA